MKKNKKMYILFIVFLIAFLLFVFSYNNVLATDSLIDGMNPGDEDASTTNSNLVKIVARLFTIVQFAGTGFSIIAIMKLGISYMFSSIEQKAEIKKRATPILIGSFIIVATVNILKIIQKVVADSL